MNPSLRIGATIAEMLRTKGQEGRDEKITSALTAVGLRADSEFKRRYPHQLSGGQQQRVTIAVAIVSGAPWLCLTSRPPAWT